MPRIGMSRISELKISMLLRKMGQTGRMLKPNRLIDKDYSSCAQAFEKSS